jgi:hypothetical protein
VFPTLWGTLVFGYLQLMVYSNHARGADNSGPELALMGMARFPPRSRHAIYGAPHMRAVASTLPHRW